MIMAQSKLPNKVALWILAREGGYCNTPGDPGGETNMGVTWPTLRRAQAKGYVPHDVTVRTLTKEHALTIYYYEYWIQAHCHELHPALALAVFDFAVHSGVSRAIRYLQMVCNSFTKTGTSLVVDGVYGKNTRATLEELFDGTVSIKTFCTIYIDMREQFLRGLVTSGKLPTTFLRGLMNRIILLRKEVEQLYPNVIVPEPIKQEEPKEQTPPINQPDTDDTPIQDIGLPTAPIPKLNIIVSIINFICKILRTIYTNKK